MKRYISPQIFVVELDSESIAVVTNSNIGFNPTPSDDFAPTCRDAVRGSCWDEYEL